MRVVRVGAGVVVAAAAVGAAAGCGSVVAGGGTAPSASAEAGPCGAAPSVRPAGWTRDAVRILAVSADCLEYEVTNEGAEPADLTVLFGWSGSGTGLSSDPTGTQTAVAPGASVRGRVSLTGQPLGRPVVPDLPVRTVPDSWPSSASPRPSGAAGPAPDVKVLRVRSVPTAEAPSTGGACPASGVRVYADRGDAAMGLRVVGLHLENCGTRDVVLDGYPRTELLDEAHAPVAGVQVLKGGSAISTGTGADAPPRRFTVAPGGKASAGLVWRNTTDLSGPPVNAPYVRVRATADAAPVMVTPELDLGTTGRIGVGAWAPEQS
ncbi:DUF4232 domain-containing protein [Kitasatospora sp. YST-16]|uniref:DUF4232 domain-containing protein n=1 Tax=Kitasatospora sp. YST-16 TaxID=2998080 RepID=UPI0022853B01|nr:DUF4232 domain-containing protein [Kitasatospora sp. YST-16]WAL70323.1 DUF4232 domain-containing protein [Kitasatospora sp. YST-16]WNW36365.1 DUF4232 domain-containing protein [Streptomyces sp. Li-HN-5-13]